MDMINWLGQWLEKDDTKIMYLLALILVANILDFVIGWINAKFNKNIQFSSGKAIFGIARKMVLFIVLVYFIPVAMLIPQPLGISALYMLFIGYLVSEINSILAHFRLAEDDKTNDLFVNFVNNIFSDKKGE